MYANWINKGRRYLAAGASAGLALGLLIVVVAVGSASGAPGKPGTAVSPAAPVPGGVVTATVTMTPTGCRFYFPVVSLNARFVPLPVQTWRGTARLSYIVSAADTVTKSVEGGRVKIFEPGSYQWAYVGRVHIPFIHYYEAERSYLSFDTSPVVGEVLTTTLTFVAGADFSLGRYAVHRGQWTNHPATVTDWSLWDAEPLITFDRTGYVPYTPMTYTLPADAVTQGGWTRLVVRSANEMTELPNGGGAGLYHDKVVTLTVHYQPQ